MEFVSLAASWETWMAANGVEILTVTTIMVSIVIAWKYGPPLVIRLRQTRLGEKLGLVGPEELRFRETERTLIDRLTKLKSILDRTKKESNRLPKPEDFGLDANTVLPGREKRYKMLMDQIKSAIHASLRLYDANQIAHLRRLVVKEINEIKDLPAMGDSVAVDTLSAINELEDVLNDLDEAAREQDRAEQTALEEARELRESETEDGPSPYRVGNTSPEPSIRVKAEEAAPRSLAPTEKTPEPPYTSREIRKAIAHADEAEAQAEQEEDDGDDNDRRRIAEPA